MKTMKKILLSAALLAPAAAMAQDCLVVLTADGQRHAHEMGTVGKITFSGGVMSVGGEGGAPDASYRLAEVSKVMFDMAAGVAPGRLAGQGAPSLLLRGGWLMGGEADGLWPCQLRVYDAAGRVVASVGGWRGEAVDLTALPKGVYVVSVGGYSAKFSK